jgi:hypothetical protein
LSYDLSNAAQARFWACAVLFFPAVSQAVAQTAPAQAAPSIEQQIAGAVLAAPDSLRSGAAVLGWQGGELVEIRKGTNELICLADDPAKDRFQVACYQKSLEPFMARGRELHRQKMSHEQVDSVRLADVKAGRWQMPSNPTALYNLVAPKDSIDATTGLPRGGTRWYVIYMPYATEASSGFSIAADASGRPWLMYPGTPWAHLMVTPK